MKRIVTPYLPVRFSVYWQSLDHHKAFDHTQYNKLSFSSFVPHLLTQSLCWFYIWKDKNLWLKEFWHYSSCLCFFSICLQFVWLWQPLPSFIISPSLYHSGHSWSLCAAHVSVSLKMLPLTHSHKKLLFSCWLSKTLTGSCVATEWSNIVSMSKRYQWDAALAKLLIVCPPSQPQNRFLENKRARRQHVRNHLEVESRFCRF